MKMAEMNQTRRSNVPDSGIAALAASVRSPRSNPMVITGGLDLVQSVLTEAHAHMEQVHARIQVIHPTDKLRIHWADYWKSFKLFYYRNWHPWLRESHALQTARLWLARAKEWLLLLDRLLHKHPPDGFAVIPALTFATSLVSLVAAIVSATARKGRCR
jgi:hypothetical protein